MRDSGAPLNLVVGRKTGMETGADGEPRRKKMRTTFTGRQIFELERMFETKKYLNSGERSHLSRLLDVSEQQVKIWFQNRRTKWKKQESITQEQAASILKHGVGGGGEESSEDDKAGKDVGDVVSDGVSDIPEGRDT